MVVFCEKTLGFKFKAIWFFVKKPWSFSKPGLEARAINYDFKIASVEVGATVCDFTNARLVLGVKLLSKHNCWSYTHLFD